MDEYEPEPEPLEEDEDDYDHEDDEILALEGPEDGTMRVISPDGHLGEPELYLENISFRPSFNLSLDDAQFHDSTVILRLSRDFNRSLDNVTLPPYLRDLIFGTMFNQSLNNVTFPALLRCIELSDDFNQSIDGVTWPPALEELHFGNRFNQSLEHAVLPGTLRWLHFGDDFNQRLHIFPERNEGLRVISLIGRNFNQSLAFWRPPTYLNLLELHRDYCHWPFEVGRPPHYRPARDVFVLDWNGLRVCFCR
jgi:hypothetical protein